jgi:hypothetical protein
MATMHETIRARAEAWASEHGETVIDTVTVEEAMEAMAQALLAAGVGEDGDCDLLTDDFRRQTLRRVVERYRAGGPEVEKEWAEDRVAHSEHGVLRITPSHRSRFAEQVERALKQQS